LSQKRLFLGENDARTVMLVRSANIPPLAPLNKDVPPELERIIAKALARDPDKRYANARDFGRDLTTFLFKYGKPVSSHDVAEMVRNTVASRKPAARAKPTTVGRMIEEALLEFKSLEDDDGAEGGTTSERLMRGRVSHFEDIAKWIEEIEANPASEARSARPVFGRRRTFEPISTRTPLSIQGPISGRPPPLEPASDAAPERHADGVPLPTAVATVEMSTPAFEREALPPPSQQDDAPPNTRRSHPPTGDSLVASSSGESQPIIIREPSQPSLLTAAKDKTQAVTIKEMSEPVVVREVPSSEMNDATPAPEDVEHSPSLPDAEESEPLDTGDISQPVGGKKRKKKSGKSDKNGDRSSRISRVDAASKPIVTDKKERSSRIDAAPKSSKRTSQQLVERRKDERSNKTIWFVVAAAALLLAAGAYYGGLLAH